MGEVIGRAVSRREALQTLTESQQFIPPDHLAAYVAALNRTRYELARHDPVKPRIRVHGWFCGNCGKGVSQECTFCWNCGKEIDRS